ncbi:hypothetical protein FQR65_LT17490 [Abscondita terminalis]|nr:hypothetical protein FQR65_LT17490 [Abscondita terminalis]
MRPRTRRCGSVPINKNILNGMLRPMTASTTAVYGTILILHLVCAIQGTPEYRLVYYPDRSYNTNPYTSYSSGQVYVTDQYGQTSISGSSYRPYSRARAAPQAYAIQDRSTSKPPCAAAKCAATTRTANDRRTSVCLLPQRYIGDPLILHSGRMFEQTPNANPIDLRESTMRRSLRKFVRFQYAINTVNHIPVCTCPPGTTGDPFTSCRVLTRADLANPLLRGQTPKCDVVNNVPTCKLPSRIFWISLSGCRHECESKTRKCGPTHSCIDLSCQILARSVQKCLECRVNQSTRRCALAHHGYFGNRSCRAKAECTQNAIVALKPACFYNSCKNPCNRRVGTNARLSFAQRNHARLLVAQKDRREIPSSVVGRSRSKIFAKPNVRRERSNVQHRLRS